MISAKRTYYKALVLLTVFSLNTVVSFACSFSSFFHGLHHHASPATKAHVHGTGEKHVHQHAGHHHQGNDAQTIPDKKESSKDDCCSQSSVFLEKLDKAVARSIEVPDHLFAAAILNAYSTLLFSSLEKKTFFPSYFRWRPPATIQDLRIVIQSFQI